MTPRLLDKYRKEIVPQIMQARGYKTAMRVPHLTKIVINMGIGLAAHDIKIFENFLSKIKHLKTTILGGIVLLKSAGMARYMNKNVAGVFVPDNLIKEMEGTKDKVATSIEIASRLIKELKPMCQGIHITTFYFGTQ